MTADRLAEWIAIAYNDWEGSTDSGMTMEEYIAQALAAAGVTVAAQPDGLDVERLARALARRSDYTDAWVLLPKEMQDLWRKDAAAIAREYGAAQPAATAPDSDGCDHQYRITCKTCGVRGTVRVSVEEADR